MLSPCIKICKLDKGICKGCGRTEKEIKNWLIYSDKKRLNIMNKLTKNIDKNNINNV